MTDPIVSENQGHAAAKQMPLRRRDLLQGAAVGAAAVATGSLAETRVEAAETVSKSASDAFGQLFESQLKAVPSDYDPAYVQNVIVPFLRTNVYQGERPALPMIDVALTKDRAMRQSLVGM